MEEWLESLSRLPPLIIDFTGGEPFIYKGMYELLYQLEKKHTVAVTTNLSLVDLDKIPLNPNIIWTLSLHPSQFHKFSFSDFMEKAHILKQRYKNVTINYVATRNQLQDLYRYYNLFRTEGFRFHVDPDETITYTEEEKSLISPLLDNDRRIGSTDFIKGAKLFSAGMRQIHIKPDGTVFRCYYQRSPMGNIFTEFKTLKCPAYCDVDCGSGCDLDAVDIYTLNGEFLHKNKKFGVKN